MTRPARWQHKFSADYERPDASAAKRVNYASGIFNNPMFTNICFIFIAIMAAALLLCLADLLFYDDED